MSALRSRLAALGALLACACAYEPVELFPDRGASADAGEPTDADDATTPSDAGAGPSDARGSGEEDAAAPDADDPRDAHAGDATPSSPDAGPRDPRPGGRLMVGLRTTCALSEGSPIRALCWGDGTQGQLDGTGITRVATPRAISGTDSAHWISMGSDHACAARTLGTVVCWGERANGKIGDGSTTTDIALSTEVPGITTALTTAVGSQHSCALLSSGEVLCWGRNQVGQVGRGGPVGGNAARVLVPTRVVGLSDVVEIGAGGQHTCALRAGGEVWCWGNNQQGQLGDGTFTFSSSPVQVRGLSDVVRLGIGSFARTSCALLRDGTARCWGANDLGQVGDGTTTDRPEPRVVDGLSDLVDLEVSWTAGCAARRDGRVTCWGRNNSGQRGNGTTSSTLSLDKTEVADITTAVEISAGGEGSYGSACALLANGRVRCWGGNAHGQLGDGTTGGFRTQPSTDVILR